MGEIRQEQGVSRNGGPVGSGERDEAGLVAAAALTPRDAFEAWYCAEAAKEGLVFLPSDIARHRKGDGYRYDYGALNGKWEAWQALAPRIEALEAVLRGGDHPGSVAAVPVGDGQPLAVLAAVEADIRAAVSEPLDGRTHDVWIRGERNGLRIALGIVGKHLRANGGVA